MEPIMPMSYFAIWSRSHWAVRGLTRLLGGGWLGMEGSGGS